MMKIQKLDNNSILKYDNVRKKWLNDEFVCIKVFNEDYIKENLNLEEFSQNRIDGKYQTDDVEISKEKKEYEESNKKKEEIVEQGKQVAKELSQKIIEREKELKKEFDNYCTIENNIEQYSELNDEKNIKK